MSSPRSSHSPRSVDFRNTGPPSLWQILSTISLVGGAGFWLGASLLLTVTPSEAAWAITLATCLVLSSGWLAVESDTLSGHLSAATWLEFTRGWTFWLAQLVATAAIGLSLAGDLLSQFQRIDAVWLLPIALVVIWVAVLGQTATKQERPFIRALALLSIMGLLGLLLTELITIAAGLDWPVRGLPIVSSTLAQLPSSDSPFQFAELIQMTALLSVTFARFDGFDSLGSKQELGLLPQTLRCKLLTITITLSWLLYFGMVIIRLLQSGDFGFVENPSLPLSRIRQSLTITPLWDIGLTVGAIAAFTGTIWLQIPSLNRQFRHLQVGCRDQWPVPKLVHLGLGISLSGLLFVGDVKTLWAFSAFAALLHRALCHWQVTQSVRFSAMNHRRCLHGVAGAMSLLLAFWLDWQVWLVSLGLIALGLVWRGIRKWSDIEE